MRGLSCDAASTGVAQKMLFSKRLDLHPSRLSPDGTSIEPTKTIKLRRGGQGMYNQKTTALFYYWMGLKQTRPAPSRRDIEPRQIKSLLPNLFMLERVDTKHIIFRLAGTAFCERYGREFREHNFLALWRGDDHLRVRTLIDQLLDQAKPGLITYRGESIDRLTLDSEILLLPICDENGQLTRLMGAAQPLKPVSTLRHRKIVKQWILDCDILNPSAAPASVNNGAPRPLRVDTPNLRLIVANSNS